MKTEAEFLEEIHNFALRFLFLQTQATSYSFYSSVIVHCNGERRKKPDRKPYPPPLWFTKSIQKPQVWELSRRCPEPSTKLYIHEFGFWSCRCRVHTWQAITAVSPSSMRSGLWSSMLTRGKSTERVIKLYYAKFIWNLTNIVFRISDG